MAEPILIHGEIEFPPDVTPLDPAHVLVELEDISRADAPSEVIARVQLVTGALSGGDVVPFTLEVPSGALNERNFYSVRVHVDVSGSGKIERGDYITMQSYPVRARGHEDKVRVAVKRV